MTHPSPEPQPSPQPLLQPDSTQKKPIQAQTQARTPTLTHFKPSSSSIIDLAAFDAENERIKKEYE